MSETLKRFQVASQEAAQLIEEGYTEVSVKTTECFPVSTIIFNQIGGDNSPDQLKRVQPDPQVDITLTATKKF